MTTVTIRAADAVTALELVQKRLGDDALILSTRSVDGFVEVLATDDPLDLPAVPAETSQRQAKPVQPPQSLVLPNFLTPDGAKQSRINANSAQRPAPVSHFGAVLQRKNILKSARIVLFGPAGAGKSVVAIQLALLRLAEQPAAKPKFFFCGSGSFSDGAMLAQKSHLLGMKTVFCPADDLPDPATDEAQIVLISGRVHGQTEAVTAAVGPGKGLGLLVLPAGLRTDAVTQLATMWQQKPERAILSRSPCVSDPEADLASLCALRITPLWVSAPDQMVGGLAPAMLPAAMQAGSGAPALPGAVAPTLFHNPVQEFSR